jgi:hypothetical protein
MFDERVDFSSNAPVDVFPYLGHRVGKVQVMKALEAVHDEFSAVEYLPHKIMIEFWVASSTYSEPGAFFPSRKNDDAMYVT